MDEDAGACPPHSTQWQAADTGSCIGVVKAMNRIKNKLCGCHEGGAGVVMVEVVVVRV